jgi:hypothetical protein
METINLKDKWRDKKSMQMQNEVSGIPKFNSSNIKQSYNQANIWRK